jgi:hypothetical protein
MRFVSGEAGEMRPDRRTRCHSADRSSEGRSRACCLAVPQCRRAVLRCACVSKKSGGGRAHVHVHGSAGQWQHRLARTAVHVRVRYGGSPWTGRGPGLVSSCRVAASPNLFTAFWVPHDRRIPWKKCGGEMQPGPGQQNGLFGGLCVGQAGLLSLWHLY